MFLDIYAIQPVPPSNINRDDTGSPKTAIYGGVQRARVSSQAWKRAMRKMFPQLLSQEKLGVRTKLSVDRIASRIRELDPELEEKEAENLAIGALKATGVKVKESKRKGSTKGNQETEYLIFIAESEISALAGLAIQWRRRYEGGDISKPSDDMKKAMKKEVSKVFHGVQAVDIALFGRMLADAPDLNTDASAQVAHSISVDQVVQEYDYFTAVDDCAAEDNAGAGMLGTVAFSSSTLYRYATVNVDALHQQLGDHVATSEAVVAFAESFARSMPAGKQNTFANRTLPTLVAVAFRSNQPINPVSAFEIPVHPQGSVSISQQAAQRLDFALKGIEEAYGLRADAAWYVTVETGGAELLANLGEQTSFAELISHMREYVNSTLSKEVG